MPHQQPRSDAPVVLVIDDEDYVADMIASALEIEGCTVHVAYNGREGLERALDLELDLLVIDIMMPYMSGVELVRRIRATERLRDTPVILISAGARPRHPLPNVIFLTKPFDMDSMLGVVDQQLSARDSI